MSGHIFALPAFWQRMTNDTSYFRHNMTFTGFIDGAQDARRASTPGEENYLQGNRRALEKIRDPISRRNLTAQRKSNAEMPAIFS